MDIKVKINRLIENSKTQAIATVEFDRMIRLTNVRIIEGANGLFVAYPQRLNNNQYENLVEFLDKESSQELRKKLQEVIIDEYNKSLEDTTRIGYVSDITEQPVFEQADFEKIKVYIDVEDSYKNQKAKGEIMLEDVISFKGMRIMQDNNEKLFIAMPSESYEKDGEKKYKNIFYPLSKDVRDDITLKSIENYERMLEFVAEDDSFEER